MGITLNKVVPLKEMTIKRWIGGMKKRGNQKFIYKEKLLIFWYNEKDNGDLIKKKVLYH